MADLQQRNSVGPRKLKQDYYMNYITQITFDITHTIQKLFSLSPEQTNAILIELNTDHRKSFGDLSCNAALMLAKVVG